MRMLFGVLGLLVALAVVAWLAKAQLRAAGQGVAAALPAASAPAGTAAPTVREQAGALQDRVRQDIGQTLQQGADRRGDEAAK